MLTELHFNLNTLFIFYFIFFYDFEQKSFDFLKIQVITTDTCMIAFSGIEDLKSQEVGWGNNWVEF